MKCEECKKEIVGSKFKVTLGEYVDNPSKRTVHRKGKILSTAKSLICSLFPEENSIKVVCSDCFAKLVFEK